MHVKLGRSTQLEKPLRINCMRAFFFYRFDHYTSADNCKKKKVSCDQMERELG